MRLRQKNLTWREIDGEIVALDLSTNTYYTANRTAAVLFRRLVEVADTEDLVSALVGAYDVTSEQAASDVSDFLSELDRQGLLDRD